MISTNLIVGIRENAIAGDPDAILLKTTNGNGIKNWEITNLPGQMNVPNPIKAIIAPDAPIPTLSGEYKKGMNMAKFAIIPPKKYTKRNFNPPALFSTDGPIKNRAIMLKTIWEMFACKNSDVTIM